MKEFHYIWYTFIHMMLLFQRSAYIVNVIDEVVRHSLLNFVSASRRTCSTDIYVTTVRRRVSTCLL
jgi:hypothetical protein